tara:strand:+ start:818 stop:1183 length:366 start_codon:yes stop_codon:yes gene_type:complete
VTADIKVHVGEGIGEMGARFVDAWRRAASGEEVHERHLTFASMADLTRTLTPKRLDLLNRLRGHPAPSIRALARDTGRDFKNVQQDVTALRDAGLIDQDADGGLTTDVDRLVTSIELARAV